METRLYPIFKASRWTPALVSAFYQFKVTPFAEFSVFMVLAVVPAFLVLLFAFTCNFYKCCRAHSPAEIYLASKANGRAIKRDVVENVQQERPINDKLYKNCWIAGVGIHIAIICGIAAFFAILCLKMTRTQIGHLILPKGFDDSMLKFEESIGGVDDGVSALEHMDFGYRELFADYAYFVQTAFDVQPEQSKQEEIEPIIAEFARMQELIELLDDPMRIPPGFSTVDYNSSEKFQLMRTVTKAFLSTSAYDFYKELQDAAFFPTLFGGDFGLFNKYAERTEVIRRLGVDSDIELFAQSEFYSEADATLKRLRDSVCSTISMRNQTLMQLFKTQRNTESFKRFSSALQTVVLGRELATKGETFVLALIIAATVYVLVLSCTVVITQIACFKRENAHTASIMMFFGPASAICAAFLVLLCICGFFLQFEADAQSSFYEIDYAAGLNGFEMLKRHFKENEVEFELHKLESPFLAFDDATLRIDLASQERLVQSCQTMIHGNSNANLGFGLVQYDVSAKAQLSQNIFSTTRVNFRAVAESCVLTGKFLEESSSLVGCFKFDDRSFAEFVEDVRDAVEEQVTALGLFSLENKIDNFANYFKTQMGVSGETAPQMHVLRLLSAAFTSKPSAEETLVFKPGLRDMRAEQRPALNLEFLVSNEQSFMLPAVPTLSDMFAACVGFVAFVGCLEGEAATCADIENQLAVLGATDVDEYLDNIIDKKMYLFGVSKAISDAMEAQISKEVADWDIDLEKRFKQRYGRHVDASDYNLRMKPLMQFNPGNFFGENQAETMFDKLILTVRLMRHSAVLSRVDYIAGKFGSTTSGYSKIDNYIDVVSLLAVENVERIPQMLRNQHYHELMDNLKAVLLIDFTAIDAVDKYIVEFERNLQTLPVRFVAGVANAFYVAICVVSTLLICSAYTSFFQREALARHLASFEQLENEQNYAQNRPGVEVICARDEHQIVHERGMMLVAITDADANLFE